MRPIQHPSNNVVLGAPSGWDQTALPCSALAITRKTIDGQACSVSFWQPSAEELKQLQAGVPVALYVFGQGFPPVALEVHP